MFQTKLIHPRYYKPIYIAKTEDYDFPKMREGNYSEEALTYFEKHRFGYGFTENIDTTINRWLEENKDKITEIVDIKYEGSQNEDYNPSALILFRTL